MAHAALGIPWILPIARIICLEMPSCFASLYRNLPGCALGDSTTYVMLQNPCEFGVRRDSDNTCQKLYTPIKW